MGIVVLYPNETTSLLFFMDRQKLGLAFIKGSGSGYGIMVQGLEPNHEEPTNEPTNLTNNQLT